MEVGRKMIIKSVKDLDVYRLAFDSAMEIFRISKDFPREEKYSLVDQIRRSSRSVCANISEAWRSRKYRASFVNKITIASQEAAETQTWLEFALKCEYLDQGGFKQLDEKYEHIYAMLLTMERMTDRFCK